MRLFSLSLAILLLALTIRLGPGTVTSMSNRSEEPGAAPVVAGFASASNQSESNHAEEPDRDESWYTPRSEDFRPHYDRDTTNHTKQTWSQYWSWVKVFYDGNLVSSGWTERSKGLVAVVTSDSEQKKLRATINALGKEIGAEWSKDYSVRKVSTADLLAWGKMLEKASGKDDGSGQELRHAMESIRDAHRKKQGGG